MSKWEKNEVNYCVELLKDGMTYDEMGKLLNRTPGSIRSRLFKLNIKYRDEQKIKRKCLFCDNEFEINRKSNKKYCSNRCSMIHYNNLKYGNYQTKKKVNFCLNCNKETTNEKYCSNKCQGEYIRKISFEKIKNGDVTLTENLYKEYLISEFGNKCMECGWNKISPFTNKVPIQLDHIDGNSDNNSLLLCPNCHSLTPTFGSLNKNGILSKRKLNRYNKTKK